MRNLMGFDEAGYGPNLGPLVIAGTEWSAPDDTVDLYPRLQSVVAPARVANRLHVADSKQVTQGARGRAALELAVLGLLNAIHQDIPTTRADLCGWLGDHPGEPDWLRSTPVTLPLHQDPAVIARWGSRTRQAMRESGCPLVSAGCRTVFAHEFNSRLEAQENKADILSAESLQLVERMIASSNEPTRNCLVICDRHGGRSRYAGKLQEQVTEAWIETLEECPTESRYRWSESIRTIEIRFQTGGEAFLPTAMASMIAKYVREVFMESWNRFWQIHVPELLPTKGYPQDARRFLASIRPVANQLGIPDHEFWRVR